MKKVESPVTYIIGLETVLLRSGRVTGVERFARGICDNLPKVGLDYRKLKGFNASLGPRFIDRIINEQLFHMGQIRGLAGIHYFSVGPPWLRPTIPFTLTVHDAVAWRYPESISRGLRYVYKPSIERAVRSKDFRGLITVSQFSANELQSVLRLRSGQIHVVPNGISSPFLDNPNLIKGKSLTRVPDEPFVLTVGTIEPRKNIGELVVAWNKANRPINLVLVGRFGWGDIPDLDGVIHLSSLGDGDLAWLYKNARAVVFPSIYEGFSLVPIEALLNRTPVIVRDLPIYTETLVGLSGVYKFQTLDDLADRILEVSQGKILAQATLLPRERFSWERYGKMFEGIMKQLYFM